MSDSYLSALLAPLVIMVLAGVFGFMAKAVLKRLPEGRLKRILGWPNRAE